MRILLVILLSISFSVFAGDIKNIRKIYGEINSKVNSNLFEKIYCYSKDADYTTSEWFCSKEKTERFSKSFVRTTLYFNEFDKIKKLSFYVTSESQDWEVLKEHYYSNTIVFVFTYQLTHLGYDYDKDEVLSNGPFVIEKREYFSKEGEITRTLKKGFYKNNKKAIAVKYLKQTEIENIINFERTPFFVPSIKVLRKE